MKRTATSTWKGSGAEGKGTLTTKSGALKNLPYSFTTRFKNEDGTLGTNPEELIAAAHSGCFNMALSFQLVNAGYTADELNTEAIVEVEKKEAGFEVTHITLELTGKVPGIEESEFLELAKGAKENCPISKALSAVDITLNAKLDA